MAMYYSKSQENTDYRNHNTTLVDVHPSRDIAVKIVSRAMPKLSKDTAPPSGVFSVVTCYQ